MASPPRQAPVVPLDLLLGEGDEGNLVGQAHVQSSSTASSPQSPASLSLALESPDGIDRYGNERQVFILNLSAFTLCLICVSFLFCKLLYPFLAGFTAVL